VLSAWGFIGDQEGADVLLNRRREAIASVHFIRLSVQTCRVDHHDERSVDGAAVGGSTIIGVPHCIKLRKERKAPK
jgi:hypothetical protein